MNAIPKTLIRIFNVMGTGDCDKFENKRKDEITYLVL